MRIASPAGRSPPASLATTRPTSTSSRISRTPTAARRGTVIRRFSAVISSEYPASARPAMMIVVGTAPFTHEILLRLVVTGAGPSPRLEARDRAGAGHRGEESDVDLETASGPGARRGGGAVGGGDGADDGQAEAVAAVAAGRARAQPLEGLEQAVDLGRRDDLPGVGHRQDCAAVAGRGGDPDVPAGDVVADAVVDQVGDQLLNQERVTIEDR